MEIAAVMMFAAVVFGFCLHAVRFSALVFRIQHLPRILNLRTKLWLIQGMLLFY
mgnify:CR=1 FL=1